MLSVNLQAGVSEVYQQSVSKMSCLMKQISSPRHRLKIRLTQAHYQRLRSYLFISQDKRRLCKTGGKLTNLHLNRILVAKLRLIGDQIIWLSLVLSSTLLGVEEFADHPFNGPFGHIHFPIKCFMRLHCELLIFCLTLNLKHDIVHPQIWSIK